jgi:hypothetical protein
VLVRDGREGIIYIFMFIMVIGGCVIGLITSANVGFRLCAFPWRGSGLPNRAVSAPPPKSGIKQSILKDPITRRLKWAIYCMLRIN